MDELTKESKDRIISNIKKGFFKKDLFEVFFQKGNKKNDVIESLRVALGINCINISKFWIHMIYNVWTNLDNTYDPKEIMLLKYILDNGGVVCRTKIKLDGMNDYMIRSASDKLEDRNVLLLINFESNQKVFLIDPEFKNMVFKNEEE